MSEGDVGRVTAERRCGSKWEGDDKCNDETEEGRAAAELGSADS